MRASEFLYESPEPKLYTIQIPPSDLKQCIALIIKYMDDSEGSYYNGDEKQSSIKDWIKKLSRDKIQHEALHALQLKNIPGIFQGLDSLEYMNDINWSKPKELINNPSYQKYISRPPEIMAFAFDASRGVDTKEILSHYKQIGGIAEKQFMHYYNEYKRMAAGENK
jgi:hypothetical protein